MNVRTFFVGALLVAEALPLAGQVVPSGTGAHGLPPERAATFEWPTHFRDQPLTQLPPGALHERWVRRFPDGSTAGAASVTAPRATRR